MVVYLTERGAADELLEYFDEQSVRFLQHFSVSSFPHSGFGRAGLVVDRRAHTPSCKTPRIYTGCSLGVSMYPQHSLQDTFGLTGREFPQAEDDEADEGEVRAAKRVRAITDTSKLSLSNAFKRTEL